MLRELDTRWGYLVTGNPATAMVGTPHPIGTFAQLAPAEGVIGRGTRLALLSSMSALENVYQYRLLIGKGASGAGLSIDEIDQLTELEAHFAASAEDQRAREGRRFSRQRVDLSGVLRGGKLNDTVSVTELAPGGVVCRSAPYAEPGDAVELVLEDEDAHRSYRFKARVLWLREEHEGDDFVVGLEFVGTPVMVHYGARQTHEPLFTRIAA